MTYRLVGRVIGFILLIEAALMLLPVAVSLIYAESVGKYFLLSIGVNVALGLPLAFLKVKNQNMYAREGFVIVAISWIAVSLMGCLPFWLSGEIPHFVDAFFETVSGFTTTGASVLSNVEALSKCMLFWRSFTHWVGGMGILVFMLAIVPATGGSLVHILRAESTGPSVEKMTPKLSATAKHLYLIYIALTAVMFVLLKCDPTMPAFDALVNSFGTAGTGGFAIRNTSIAGYSAYSQIVITVFMIVFGVNFNIYFLVVLGKLHQAYKNEELRAYLGIVLASIVLIVANLMHSGVFRSLSECIRHAAFQVASIISTTGFSTVDFNLWPEFSKVILFLLMFIGSCAGSTAGGIKVSRILITVKAIKNDIYFVIHPRSVKSIRLNGKALSPEIVSHTLRFTALYVVIYVVSFLLVSLDNFDFTTSATAVAATLNNIGPGLGLAGPAGNFGGFSVLSKLIMIADMLIGRLEVMPMMILFYAGTWKKK